jgi:hypothetical protein
MDRPFATTNYKNHCFPVELLSHTVGVYFRFCLGIVTVFHFLLFLYDRLSPVVLSDTTCRLSDFQFPAFSVCVDNILAIQSLYPA